MVTFYPGDPDLNQKPEPLPDFLIENHGSVWLFRIQGDAVLATVKELVDIADWQWQGTHAFACDHRVARVLASELVQDGFTVEVR